VGALGGGGAHGGACGGVSGCASTYGVLTGGDSGNLKGGDGLNQGGQSDASGG
jgi:hypothetical protein